MGCDRGVVLAGRRGPSGLGPTGGRGGPVEAPVQAQPEDDANQGHQGAPDSKASHFVRAEPPAVCSLVDLGLHELR